MPTFALPLPPCLTDASALAQATRKPRASKGSLSGGGGGAQVKGEPSAASAAHAAEEDELSAEERTAVLNYAQFHGLPTATLGQVKSSSPGISGWAR